MFFDIIAEKSLLLQICLVVRAWSCFTCHKLSVFAEKSNLTKCSVNFAPSSLIVCTILYRPISGKDNTFFLDLLYLASVRSEMGVVAHGNKISFKFLSLKVYLNLSN